MSDAGKKLKRVARSKKSKAASKSKHHLISRPGEGARTISQSILREHGAESSAFRQHLEQTWNLHASAVVDLENAQKKEAELRSELSLANSQTAELERRISTSLKRSHALEEELSEVSAELYATQEKNSELVDELSRYKIKAKTVEAQLGRSLAEFKSSAVQIDNLRSQLACREEELASMGAKVDEHGLISKNLAMEISKTKLEVSRAEKEKRAAEAEIELNRTHFEARIKELSEEVVRLRAKAEEGKRSKTQIIELERHQKRLEHDLKTAHNEIRCSKEKAKETMSLLSKKLKSLEDQGTDTVAELSSHALQQKETIVSLREKLGTSLLEIRELRQAQSQANRVLEETRDMAGEEMHAWRLKDKRKSTYTASLVETADRFASENMALKKCLEEAEEARRASAAEADARVSDLEEKYAKEKGKLKAEIEHMKTAIAKAEEGLATELSSAIGNGKTLSKTVEELRAEVSASHERETEASEASAALKLKLEDSAKEVEKALKDIAERTEDMQELSQQLQEARAKNGDLREKLQEAREEVSKRETRIDSLREQHARALTDLQDELALVSRQHDKDRAKLRAEGEKARAEAAEAIKSRKNLRSTLDGTLRKLEEAVDQVKVARDAQSKTKNALSEASARRREADDALKEKLKVIRKLKEEGTAAHALIEKLKGEQKTLQGDLESKKLELRSTILKANAELEKERQKITRQTIEKKRQEEEIASQVLAFTTGSRKLAEEMAVLEERSSDLEAELSEKDRLLSDAVRTIKQLKNELVASEEEARAEAKRLAQALEASDRKLQRVELQKKEVAARSLQRNTTNATQLDNMRKENARLESKLDEQQWEIDRLIRDCSACRAENSSLSRKLARFARESQSLRHIEDTMSQFLRDKVSGGTPRSSDDSNGPKSRAHAQSTPQKAKENRRPRSRLHAVANTATKQKRRRKATADREGKPPRSSSASTSSASSSSTSSTVETACSEVTSDILICKDSSSALGAGVKGAAGAEGLPRLPLSSRKGGNPEQDGGGQALGGPEKLFIRRKRAMR